MSSQVFMRASVNPSLSRSCMRVTVVLVGNNTYVVEVGISKLLTTLFSLTLSCCFFEGAIAEYPVEIEAGGKGLASTRQISSVAGSLSEAISYEMATRSWIIERGNFLCAGYASTRGYA